MNTENNIATDLFYKIRSRFTGLKLGAATGEITILPEEARFFDFDYMEDETPIGHVSISLAEPNSMKIYFSHGITEEMDPVQKKNWYGFLKELRIFAKRRLLSFDTRDIAKDNLDRRDYNFLSKSSMDNTIGEAVMKESSMYGSKKISYQKLLDTRLIIKHNKTLQDDTVPGARSRNISALFVENQDGERFKYPFVHLSGARAMQRHVANGGMPYDEIGKSVVKMSEEIAQLKSFSNYVVRNDLMNSDTNTIVERGSTALTQLRKQLENISKQKHYEAYKENFQVRQSLEIPEDVEADYTEKFTVKNFNDNIKEAFPVIYRLMKEAELSSDNDSIVEYQDVLALTEFSNDKVDELWEVIEQFTAAIENKGVEGEIDKQTFHRAYEMMVAGDAEGAAEEIASMYVEYANDIDIEAEYEELVAEIEHILQSGDEGGLDHFAGFESWVNELGEDNAIASPDPAAQRSAIKKLQSLVGEHFPVGVDGINAIESIKGIIDDSNFNSQVKEMAVSDSEADVRPLVQSWIQENAPEVLDQLNFDNMGTDEAAGEEQRPQKLNVQEVAEFIHSFYDKESATFPKGPEGVCTMVGKKFGEQAENAARQMVERMAPQQSAGTELDELSRISQLAGR